MLYREPLALVRVDENLSGRGDRTGLGLGLYIRDNRDLLKPCYV